MYADMLTSHMSEMDNQPIGHVCRSVQISDPDQPGILSKNTASDSKEHRKQRFLRQWSRATCTVWVPSVNCILMTVESNWLTLYVEKERQPFCDCHTAELSEEVLAVKLLRI